MMQSDAQAPARGSLCEKRHNRTSPRALPLGARIGLAAALTLALLGCERKSVPTRPAPVMPEVKSTTPEEVATSALLLLRTELRAIANKDAATTAKCRELCAGLIAKSALARELKLYAPILGENPGIGLADNWAAAIAAYSEGLDLEKLSVPEFSETDKSIGVYVPVTGPAGRADLRIDCVRDGDKWLIGSIAFEGTQTIKIPVGSVAATRTPAAATSAPARP